MWSRYKSENARRPDDQREDFIGRIVRGGQKAEERTSNQDMIATGRLRKGHQDKKPHAGCETAIWAGAELKM